MLRNCRALKTSESEDVVVSPFRNKFKILSRTLVGMSGILMDSREDGESFKILLSKGEKFDIAATTDGSTIVELPSLPIILVPVPIRTLLKDLQWTCEMTGLGTALLANLVLFFCEKSFCSKCFRHILGPFAPTIFGRSIFKEVIHLWSLSSSFGNENCHTFALHTKHFHFMSENIFQDSGRWPQSQF